MDTIDTPADCIASLRAILDTAPMPMRIQLDGLALRFEKALRMMGEEARRPASDLPHCLGILGHAIRLGRTDAAKGPLALDSVFDSLDRRWRDLRQTLQEAGLPCDEFAGLRMSGGPVKASLYMVNEPSRADGRMPLAAQE